MISDSLQFKDNLFIDSLNLNVKDTLHFSVHNIQCDNSESVGSFVLKNSLTILLALMAGLIALYQVKSNIISAARIKWIEDLRHSLSELYSVSMDCIYYGKALFESEDEADFNKYQKALTKFNILANKIRMQLNSSEEDHKKLEDILSVIDGHIDDISEDKKPVDQEVIEKELKKMVVISKTIFKKEWEKSKKIFRI